MSIRNLSRQGGGEPMVMKISGVSIYPEKTGGPNVTQATTKGFGSLPISGVLAADFNGDVRINHAPDGVVCVMTAKLEK